MILDDIKQFLIDNNLAQEELIKFDYDSANGNEVVLLELYNNLPCDLARRSSVSITYKLKDLKLARNNTFAVHDLFFPQDGFQKALNINSKMMHVKLNKGPYYSGLDASKRHNYILDITLIYDR